MVNHIRKKRGGWVMLLLFRYKVTFFLYFPRSFESFVRDSMFVCRDDNYLYVAFRNFFLIL